VNDQKTAGDTDCVQAPKQVKNRVIASPHINRKEHSEHNQLGENVDEKEFELAQKPAADHERGDAQLKNGVDRP
jgi:hypothetical protein